MKFVRLREGSIWWLDLRNKKTDDLVRFFNTIRFKI